MPIVSYRALFGEVDYDPHGSFAPVLRSYRADADNATSHADLNGQWAEDPDHNPLLGIALVERTSISNIDHLFHQ